MLWRARQLVTRHRHRVIIDQLIITLRTPHCFSSSTSSSTIVDDDDGDDYTNLLEACIRSKSLVQAKAIHQRLIKTNTHNTSHYLHLQKLSRLYLTCHRLDLARRVFDKIPQPINDVVLYNLLIKAYAWNGPFQLAIDLYRLMLHSDDVIRPTKYTYPFVLKACSALQALQVGREIHEQVKRHGLSSDVYVCTALIDLYAKCGDLTAARSVFDGMTWKDVVAWNAMVAGYALHGNCDESLELLVKMPSPNSSTIVAVLPTVAKAKALRRGKEIHCYSISRSFCGDDKDDGVVISTALLDMYAKCGCIGYARRIFDRMSVRNEVCWSAMIGAYASCDMMREAMGLFDEMMVNDRRKVTRVAVGSVLRACTKVTDLRRGRRVHCVAIKAGFDVNTMVGNTIVSMYAKCGMIDDAFVLFDAMEVKDTVSYGAMISGCVQNGYAKEALLMFHRMQLCGIEADLATMAGVFPACSHLAALKHGACGHGYAIVHGFVTETSICNALIDMYSKCGKIHIGCQVFDRMLKRDIISWNTMIVGYGIHGLGTEAISQFHNMKDAGIKPDDVTFIGLLSACSHSGLVTEGKHWFSAMSQDFSIVPRMEHYICMVDLLARAGLLAEAHSFIQEMPLEADVRVWSALLAACRVHSNIELGEEVSEKVQELGHESTGNLVLLSNMYSSIGRWDDAADVRIKQKDQGLKKSPGCSWVEINGVIHGFVGGDQSHPESAQILEKLEELLVDMKRMGYCADNSFVLQDVEDEEKERILLYHSEKLAIAYAILSLSPGKPIFVTKNLRVCGDCHAAIKFISLVAKRDITVRDVSRFHHFRDDGICSCADFW